MEIDWNSVEKILVVRLRSIGDSVLSTPAIIALRNFLPGAKIDLLLEDWVAPLFEGFQEVDEVISVAGGSLGRLKTAIRLRKRKYDLVYNLHGGTTSGFFVRATGARHRIGFEYYQYGFLNNHRYPDATGFWDRPKIHSAEQQLALIGFSGVPFKKSPVTRLAISDTAAASVNKMLAELKVPPRFALIHPAAATETKRWRAANFARVVDHFNTLGIASVMVTQESQKPIVERIRSRTSSPVFGLSELTLQEVTALAARCDIFVGNDSGIAHIAAAVGKRVVVIFGSSDAEVWRPWTDSPYRVVRFPLFCQPCPGDKCREFGEPRCILSVEPEIVTHAIDELLK